MKNVEIILEGGMSVLVKCRDVKMRWSGKSGKLEHFELDEAEPEIAYVDINSIVCVVIKEMKETRNRTSGRSQLKTLQQAVAEQALQSAT